MQRKHVNVALIGAGLASVVAFFLPFVDIGGLIQASGLDVLLSDGLDWTTRIALLALPLGGVALALAGLTDSRRGRLVGFAFGAGVYGYLGYHVVRAFLATTGVGLWITLAAAATALVVALVGKR